MRLRPVVLAALLLAVPLAASDGTGGDAGNARSTAMPLAPGVHVGDMPPGDVYDWYAIELPAGRSLEIAFEADFSRSTYASPYASIDVYTESDRLLYAGTVSRWSKLAGFRGGEGPETLYLRVGSSLSYTSDPRPFTYNLTAMLVDLPDFVVTGLAEAPVPLMLHDLDLGPGTLREVSVTVTNTGAGPGFGTLTLTADTADGRGRWLGVFDADLSAGESATFTARWNTMYHLGDVTLNARVNAWGGESDTQNNPAFLRTSVGPASGLPGFTLPLP